MGFIARGLLASGLFLVGEPMAAIDMTGRRFGKLTAIKIAGSNPNGMLRWLCSCDCGGESVVAGHHLRSGNVSSCGCATKLEGKDIELFIEIYNSSSSTSEVSEKTGIKQCTVAWRARELRKRGVYMKAMKPRDRKCPKVIRFWKYVKKANGCWKWTGSKDNHGYGQIRIAVNRCEKAHRISWEIHNGPIPEGLWVLHKCDNPECCNPEHLFTGTLQDNIMDMVKKGRQSKGSAKKISKLSESTVEQLRIDRKSGMSYSQLAIKYGVSVATAFNAANHKTWKHVK